MIEKTEWLLSPSTMYRIAALTVRLTGWIVDTSLSFIASLFVFGFNRILLYDGASSKLTMF